MMKIACLQFAPQVGQVAANIDRADEILANTNIPAELDWLILPEMAFSGYNFPSSESIQPFLEPTTSGISTQWAQNTARHYNCHVTVGYPERTTTQPIKYFNSTVTVSRTGQVLKNYRKTFLYFTDELWAQEGDERFFSGPLGGLGLVSLGICMDINPYKFVAPWTDFEFANAALQASSPLVALSMAWLTRLPPERLDATPQAPDVDTLTYWVQRFQPILRSRPSQPVVIVMANRCGKEGDVCYAGSSTIMRAEGDTFKIYDILGMNEEKCLIVDLEDRPKYAAVEPN